MKVICLGGKLASFTPDFIAGGVADLEDVVTNTEPFILVCHGGSPYIEQSSGEESAVPVIDPELLTYKLHAVLLTHRADPASSKQLEKLAEDVKPVCSRVFGLRRGWNEINENQRTSVISFLESDDNAPADGEVRSLLGYDSPVSRLALRVALEIALRELGETTQPRRPGAPLSLETLLAPALALAEEEPSLALTVAGISTALASNRKTLPEEITRALAELRS